MDKVNTVDGRGQMTEVKMEKDARSREERRGRTVEMEEKTRIGAF